MRLADVEIDELVEAFRAERSAWIKIASEENRRHSEAERTAICVLAALESVLKRLPA